MELQQIIAYVFLISGLLDFIVIPRILIHKWEKAGQNNDSQKTIVQMLRISGLVLVIIGGAFLYGFIKI